MKIMILAASLMLSLGAFAQARIEVTPSIPVECKTVENYRFVNWVYDVKKVSEDDKTVSYTMKIQHGSCVSGRPNFQEIDEKLAYVSVERTRRLFGLGQGIQTTVTPAAHDELDLAVTFDKTVLFKKGNTSKLILFFSPGSWNSVRYLWNVVLLMNPESKEVRMAIY